MPYQISIKKRVLKALEKIDKPYYSSIKTAIYALADNPRPFGYLKLKGKKGYRIRVSDYRIIYDIYDSILIVDVVELGDRKDIYD
jgi:mRNA interferase RelE/StbE